MPFPVPPARRLRPSAVAAALAIAAWAAPAAAQDLDDLTVMGWSLSNVRGGVRVAPDYMGSDEYKLSPSGSLNLYRRGTAPSFGAPDDGVSVTLAGSRGVSFGVAGRWRSSRDDDGDLEGFDKIDGTVEAGAFVNWQPAPWARVRLEARHGFGGHDSWLADLRLDAFKREGPWTLSVGPRLSWADKDFTETYFAVTPADAIRSPLVATPYAPDDVTWSAGVVGSAEYRMSRRWSVSVIGDYRRLTGGAADSPIVADLGSKNQFAATFSVRYWFGKPR